MTTALSAIVAAALVSWLPVRSGVWRAEMRMAPSGALSSVRAVIVKLDPSVLRFTLDTATRDDGMRGAWTLERTPAEAVVAFNAGQFTGGIPWGWLVRDGSELQQPGKGSLGMALVVDSAGHVNLAGANELPSLRGHVQLAFQSYPALLDGDGVTPPELQSAGRGIDLEHRDSRLALGLLADGSLVVVLTRFAGMGRGGERLPFGPTVVEMAAFMRALGCRRAMLLDGGISSQLAIRSTDGALTQWPNFRAVPLALVISPRMQGASRAPTLRTAREH